MDDLCDLRIGRWRFGPDSQTLILDETGREILGLERGELTRDEAAALFPQHDWDALSSLWKREGPEETVLLSSAGDHLCFSAARGTGSAGGYVQDVSRFVELGAGKHAPTAVLSRAELIERGGAIFDLRRPYAILMLDVSLVKPPGGCRSRDFAEWVVRRLRFCIRRGDLVAQFGEHEFALALVGANAEAARRIAQRINGEDRIHPVGGGNGIFHIGYTVSSRDDQSFADTLSRADQALYIARSGGSNESVFC